MTDIRSVPADKPRALGDVLVLYFDSYIAHAGIAPTAFGFECVGDGKFMARMRQGKVTLRNIERALAYVERTGSGPAAPGTRQAARAGAAVPASPAEARRFKVLPADRFLAALRRSGQRFEDDPEAVRPEPKFSHSRPLGHTAGGVSSYGP